MTESLSDLWSSWVAQYAASSSRCSSKGAQINLQCLSALPLSWVMRTYTEQLGTLGCAGPSRGTFLETLERDVEPIGKSACPVTRRQGKRVTQMHVLNLFWQPLLQYIDALANGVPASWSSGLAENQRLIVLEMQGIIEQPEVAMSMDDWLGFLEESIRRLLDVTVPRQALRAVVSAIVPQSLDPTRANAYTILRSRACTSKIVGPTLGLQISRLVLAEVAEVPVALVPPGALILGLKRDIVNTLSNQHLTADTGPTECVTPVKKARRDPGSRQEMMGHKTRQCLWILENRLAVRRASATLLSAQELIASLHDRDSRDSLHPDTSESLSPTTT